MAYIENILGSRTYVFKFLAYYLNEFAGTVVDYARFEESL